MRKIHAAGIAVLAVLALGDAAGAAESAGAPRVDPSLFSAMRWRMVGPFRGGRTNAAVGVPGHPDRFYFGAVGGGVWKTENAGRTWEPIFDSQPVASIGALEIAPSDSKVIYVGSGEADMRSDISYGNGMYRSSDGGRTWSRIGLADTRQIGRIAIDPKDSNRLFVAALGHGYGPNRERGLFRSSDGGATWKCVLCPDENTGAIDVALDPADSRVVLAALWQTRRPPWNVYPPSNGPGSGLHRSTDGGETWSPVKGLPGAAEKLGRIRIAFAPSKRGRVYAIADADSKSGGLYVSEDSGATWMKRSSDRRIWGRGWYFAGVTVDPKDAEVVYACDTALYRSADGGRTFLPFKGSPGGDDYHRLWIDPADSRRMIFASDQGAGVTVDGGKTWSSWMNQPTAQIYHVATDDRFPYWIYGAQQDSGAAAVPSRVDEHASTSRHWRTIAPGGENDYIVPDPQDPAILWGGRVDRFDWTTSQSRNFDPAVSEPLDDPEGYRGEWTLPLAIRPEAGGSPKTIFFGNQFVWRSEDDGKHWRKASPDLTREAPAVPGTLDPVTARDSQVKGPRRGVVYAIATSPFPAARGTIWAGTDDGLVWISKDDAKTWKNVTPPDLDAWSKVAVIEASRFEADIAYVTIDRHRLDDIDPHILRTRDGGRTWSWISNGIPPGSSVNVVREDPARRSVLYAGTETGVFVSFDEGEAWQPLQLNLPVCSVRDIDARHGDLVIATHGRSFWVLDDLSPLQQVPETQADTGALHLYKPRPAIRIHPAGFLGTPDPKDEPLAENPPGGAIIDYFVRSSAPAGSRLTIEILDANGALVRRWASDEPPRPPDMSRLVVTPDWEPGSSPLSTAPGMHRLVWDLRAALPPELTSRRSEGDSGLRVPPSGYTVSAKFGGDIRTRELEVRRDPRVPGVTIPDLHDQYSFLRQIQDERVTLGAAMGQADGLRKQVAAARGKASPAGTAALDAAARSIDRAAGPSRAGGEFAEEPEDAEPANLRRVSGSLERLSRSVESADAAPTPDEIAGFAKRRDRVRATLARWREWLATELPKVNGPIEAAGLPPLSLATDRSSAPRSRTE